ncbi:Zn(2)-C7 fungal-type transcription factor [Pseudohyphozyma bogoriensis]|nr:Zn(2)-C7 fungal-type transcription factor [Pseudohyphozyma bogoriensis]
MPVPILPKEPARAMFGDAASHDNVASADLGGISVDPIASTSRLPPPIAVGVPAVNRMNDQVVEGAIASSMVNVYLGGAPFIVRATEFNKRWDRAHHQQERLEGQERVLFAVFLALASRSSDHPALIGEAPSGTSIFDLASQGMDLSVYGRRRIGACQALIRRAVRMADEDPEMSQYASSFRHSGNGHVRRLLEDTASPSPLSTSTIVGTTPLGLICVFRDAMLSSREGRRPFFDGNDLLLLRDGAPPAPPFAEALLARMAPTMPQQNEVQIGPFFNSFMHHIASVAEGAGTHLYSRPARNAPYLDLNFIESYFSQLQLGFLALPTLSTLLANGISDPSFRPLRPIPGVNPRDLGIFMKGLKATVTSQMLELHTLLRSRLEETRTRVEMTPEGAEYRCKLEVIVDKTRSVAFMCAHSIAVGIKEALEDSLVPGATPYLDLPVSRAVFSDGATWLPLLFEAPTVEVDPLRAPVDFTYDAKLADLRTVLQSLSLLGWGYPKLAEPHSTVREQIAKVEAERSAYWHSLSSLPSAEGTPTALDELFSEQELSELLGASEYTRLCQGAFLQM